MITVGVRSPAKADLA